MVLKPPSRLGIKHTEESKALMRSKAIGRSLSEATKQKLVIISTGKKLSEETKNRIRLAMIGKNVGKQGRSGCLCNLWKGGISKLVERIRTSFEYRQWRSDVFTRDDFTCVKCGKRGGELQAHHIKHFIDIIRENKIKTIEQALVCSELWDINKGETQCVSCHKSEHSQKKEKLGKLGRKKVEESKR